MVKEDLLRILRLEHGSQLPSTSQGLAKLVVEGGGWEEGWDGRRDGGDGEGWEGRREKFLFSPLKMVESILVAESM